MPKVSIIIPCYNHGKYVDEAVQSCLAQTYQDIEIIIVNDGSTDEFTCTYLEGYQRPKTRIITTKNQGLAMARNTGVMSAKGEYILPLDADDKIAPTYLEKAVHILESRLQIGIVYCNAEFFGVKTGLWELPDYNFPDILSHNCIFCSAVYRKYDWEKVGGYKKEMKYGWEDYEFWLSLIEKGCQVYKIPEVLFYYRQHEVSMIKRLDPVKCKYLYNVIFSLHKDLYQKNKKFLDSDIKNMFKDFNHPFFYKTKIATHKIYHFGPLKLKIRRKHRKGKN